LINVDVSASTEAFVGTVCLIAVRRSVSGRTVCRRCGRVGETPCLCSSTCLTPLICIASLIHLSTLLPYLLMTLAWSQSMTARQLIIFQLMCMPAILFLTHLFAGPSNFGCLGQIFWHIIRGGLVCSDNEAAESSSHEAAKGWVWTVPSSESNNGTWDAAAQVSGETLPLNTHTWNSAVLWDASAQVSGETLPLNTHMKQCCIVSCCSSSLRWDSAFKHTRETVLYCELLQLKSQVRLYL